MLGKPWRVPAQRVRRARQAHKITTFDSRKLVRIAFLCKRHYTGKDVILDRYGRLYQLATQLALLGHEVRAWCMDYRTRADGTWRHDAQGESLAWTSRGVGGPAIQRLVTTPHWLQKQLATFHPQLLIGSSDIPHVAMAAWLSRRLGVPYVVDLYDNFESFAQARIPGFRSLLRHSVRGAKLVLTVSGALQLKVVQDYAPSNPVLNLPNGVDTSVFCPGDRPEARRALALPTSARLIGTAGALSRAKGVDTLYLAWRQIEAASDDVHLVLAGPVERGFPPPEGPRVHYLGELPENLVAQLFRALDVGVIPMVDSAFGRYCFPQKAYEMLATGLPVAVARVGEMATLFKATPQIMFDPSDADDLKRKIGMLISHPVSPRVPARTWAELMKDIEPALKEAARPFQ